MTKYTPGPWTIRYEYNVVGSGRVVANTGTFTTNTDIEDRIIEQNKANARLIAAAPELLAMTRWLAASLQALCKHSNITEQDEITIEGKTLSIAQLLDAANVAIGKATQEPTQ